MNSRKKDITQFFVWLRNGSAICITWFLLLLLLRNVLFDIETVSTVGLFKMVVLVVGGVLLFCTIFTSLFIKSWRFMTRLTWFVVLISVYECIGFYWIGFFTGKGTVIQWLIFIAIILLLYSACMGIYQIYSNRKGKLYTEALYQYQERRSMENGR